MMSRIIPGIDPEIQELVTQEVRLAIVLGLDFFDSLNLRQLSRWVGKTEPTTFTHVRLLLQKELIEIDISKANMRGKYYRLSEKGQALLDDSDIEVGEDEDGKKIVSKDFLEFFASTVESISTMGATMGRLVANNLRDYPEYYKSRIEDTMNNEIPFNLGMNLTDIRLKNSKIRDEFNQIYNEFQEKMQDLSERSKTPEDVEITDNLQVIFMLSVPLSRFSPTLNPDLI